MNLSAIRKQIPEADTVVFVHGLLGSCRNLFRLYDAVHKEGFSVFAYDQRGHGHSPHGSPESYTVQQLAADAIELMKQQGIQKAHFVGHSLGGRVSLLVAALAPTLVQSLTLLDVGPRVSRRGVDNVRDIILPMPPSFANREEADQFLSRYQDAGLQQFLRSNLRDRDGILAWIFDLHGIKTRLLEALEENYESYYATVQCPIHLVRGALSSHLSAEELQYLQKNNSKAFATTIQKAGHWVHVDNFEDTAAAVIQFLQKHSSRSTNS
ncbi:MAG TPA: alpha/beta hydrolase [Oligoflexia bacterium]|nr:alpha/beta hydrolase [Oligoflexia bacterium]